MQGLFHSGGDSQEGGGFVKAPSCAASLATFCAAQKVAPRRATFPPAGEDYVPQRGKGHPLCEEVQILTVPAFYFYRLFLPIIFTDYFYRLFLSDRIIK
jgi:hypothetical protein